MQPSQPYPDDALLALWTSGTLEERKRVLEIAWERYRVRLLFSLKNSYSGLAWQDCEDFAGDAFACLWIALKEARFAWQGSSHLFAYLRRIALNDACEFVRKCKRRAGKEEEIAMREEWRALDSGFEWMVRIEADVLKRSYYAAVVERLIECTRKMKPAQRSVGVLMMDSFVACGRWPTNERLIEVLKETEPDLKLSTVKERRKEVVAKFRPILNPNSEDTIW